jgi:hypothetical protein
MSVYIGDKHLIMHKTIERNTGLKSISDSKVYQQIEIYEDNLTLESLGILEVVSNRLFLNCFNLKDLGNLKRVGGECNIRNSKLKKIENLHVKGNLNISYNEIEILENVTVDGVLILPSHWRNRVNMIGCSINKIVHRKSERRTLDNTQFPSLYLEPLKYRNHVNLNNGEIEIQFYHSENEINSIINSKPYSNLKSDFYTGILQLKNYNFNSEVENFFGILNGELLYRLKSNSLSKEKFIEWTFFQIMKFNESELFEERSVSWDYFRTSNEFYSNYYRLNGRYELVLELINLNLINVDFSLIHDLEYNLRTKVLNGNILFNQFGLKSLLNNYTQENLSIYVDFLDEVIDDIYSDEYSFFHSLFKKNKSIKEINSEFPSDYPTWDNAPIPKEVSFKKLRTEYEKQIICTEPFVSYQNIRHQFPEKSKKKWVGHGVTLLHPTKGNTLAFNIYLENLITEIFSSIVFYNENEFRDSRGVPRIGEGWISETNLYYELKSYFNEHEVIHHGKPKWLGNQHVDIWFPKFKIGVEYQGKQHFEPIEFFGGEESFFKNQERDIRKKILFKENNCILIEVTKGYNIENVTSEIEKYIEEIK